MTRFIAPIFVILSLVCSVASAAEASFDDAALLKLAQEVIKVGAEDGEEALQNVAIKAGELTELAQKRAAADIDAEAKALKLSSKAYLDSGKSMARHAESLKASKIPDDISAAEALVLVAKSGQRLQIEMQAQAVDKDIEKFIKEFVRNLMEKAQVGE